MNSAKKSIAFQKTLVSKSAISHFSKLISKEQGIETKEFNPDSLKLLEDYEWSGNIRELRNVVERLIILGGNPISKDDVNLFASKT